MTGQIVDLSVLVDGQTKGPPSTDVKVGVTTFNRGPGFWQVSSVNQSLHTGSHVDSPLHVIKGAPTIAEIGLERVIGTAVVFDLSHVGPMHAITQADLEKCDVDCRKGDIILLRTDWSDKYWGKFPDYFTDSPYLTEEGAKWLASKEPKAIGFDFFEEYSARLKDFTSEDFVTHKAILSKGIIIMEGLTNLKAISGRRVNFFAPFYKIAGVEGAPARFFAILG